MMVTQNGAQCEKWSSVVKYEEMFFSSTHQVLLPPVVHVSQSETGQKLDSCDAFCGHGQLSTAPNRTLVDTDDQRVSISCLAEEHAQIKLQEEDAWFTEQKARVVMHLKDLEQKKFTIKITEAAKADHSDWSTTNNGK